MRGARSPLLKEIVKDLEKNVLIPVPKQQKLLMFLEYLSETGLIGESARNAQLTRRDIYQAKKDPDFLKLYEQALELGTEVLEDEAFKRANHGTLEPVFHRGRRIASVKKKSDLLMMFLLKARRPEKYRDSYTAPQVTSYDDAPESPLEIISSRIARIAARKTTPGDSE